MASTSKRTQQPTAGNGAAAAVQQGTGAWAHMARQQLVWAADTMAMLFRAGESIQQAQLHMAQRGALLSQQAAENLRNADTPLELASIQASLMAYEYQEALRYFQELMLAGAKATATSAKAQPREENVNATAADATAQVVEAAMNAAAPMAQAWQQMFTMPNRAAATHH